MSTTHRALVLSLALCGAIASAHAGPNDPKGHPNDKPSNQARRVEVVLAIDTSSSMDGLIDAARQKMWDVVNLLAKAQPQPILRVGLLSYGNTGYDAAGGWVRKDIDLTTDLDSVYGRLFGLTTNGGDEYVARAVKVATDTMSWSQDQGTLRIVFVAGNESAEQDPLVKIDAALANAREHGIYVNTIFCGPQGAGDATSWARVASLGKGKFAAIDQNRVVAIATPQDAELSRLSDELNKTYIGYGRGGRGGLANQAAQDKNAHAASAPAAASRAASKASGLYRADEWDLVDATAAGKKDVKTMAAAELPEPMRALAPEARAAIVKESAEKRQALKKRIQAVNTERERYLVDARKKSAAKAGAASSEATMDDALLGGIRSEAQTAGFAF